MTTARTLIVQACRRSRHAWEAGPWQNCAVSLARGLRAPAPRFSVSEERHFDVGLSLTEVGLRRRRRGAAYVRDMSSRTVDVVAMSRGRLELYWIDELGRSELADSRPATARYILDRTFQAAVAALAIAMFTIAVAVHERKGALLIGLGGLLAVVIFAGWRNQRRYALEHQVKRLPDDGYAWIEIRTRVEDDDGG